MEAAAKPWARQTARLRCSIASCDPVRQHPDSRSSICQFIASEDRASTDDIAMPSTTTTASDLASVWFGELSAVLRGKKRQATPSMSHAEQQQQQMGGGVHGKKKTVGAATQDVDRKETGGMSDATVYLLLDHFAPS
uniref:Uncharacterized protein n=1 Tax=Avena sativa TaxID=4498 RepID=A0ACD5XM82_AVESA